MNTIREAEWTRFSHGTVRRDTFAVRKDQADQSCGDSNHLQ